MSALPLLFWDVDTQHDFMAETGKLYVPGAVEVIPQLARLTELARSLDIPVIASADDHLLGDDEISETPDFATTYPPHCMRGTLGAGRIAETVFEEAEVVGHEPVSEGRLTTLLAADPLRLVVLKRTTDVFSNPNAVELVRRLDPQRVVVYGVALDICNRLAVEGLRRLGVPRITVVADATRALDPRRGEELLAGWRSVGIEVVTTEELAAQLISGGALRQSAAAAVSSPLTA